MRREVNHSMEVPQADESARGDRDLSVQPRIHPTGRRTLKSPKITGPAERGEHGHDVLLRIDPQRVHEPEPAATIDPRLARTQREALAAIAAARACGDQTLGAVFEVLRFEWDRWLVKHGLREADIAAIRFEYVECLDRGLAHAPTETDGGIDLLVVEQFALGGRPIDVSALYGAGVARHSPYVVPAEPGGWQSGPYTVITDVVGGDEVLPEIYNLRATDGSFAQGLILPDEAFDNGFLELRFTDVPCDRRYRLDVEIVGVGNYEIFADLAYADLHAFAEGLHSDSSKE